MTDAATLTRKYIERQPRWYEEMIRLNRFLGETASAAASRRERVKPVAIVERIGSGARTLIRRQATALNVQAYDIRPGLMRFPDVEDAEGWAEILSPYAVSMPIVEVGDPKGLDTGSGALDAVRALHMHAPADMVMILATTFFGMPDHEAARMVADACGVDVGEVAVFVLEDLS